MTCTIRLTEHTRQAVDVMRGETPRSAYLRSLIEQGLALQTLREMKPLRATRPTQIEMPRMP